MGGIYVLGFVFVTERVYPSMKEVLCTCFMGYSSDFWGYISVWAFVMVAGSSKGRMLREELFCKRLVYRDRFCGDLGLISLAFLF